MSYILQSTVYKYTQHPEAIDTGSQSRIKTHRSKLLTLTVPPSAVVRHELPRHLVMFVLFRQMKEM